MPYILISTHSRLECGPTVVGDEWSDQELMEYLGATLSKQLGNNFLEYKTQDPARIVLNKLEMKGYRVVGMSGSGQTCIWTLHKAEYNIINAE
ncbi:hypothetical protein LOTGIDRAFT_192160 [Lottia gigantea]|uniref:GTP cyclohydrolase 1 feedback regulatory protein n=1 Tax=Lottia gigantea TaxID=225164 RepID=V3ZFU5_LOTGI|nr:hypothetical protein LOTGIDRAFT_192160 [Lottia gigantea]ESO90063.1 hypothetical protein LOTGIDRAFT_192160 [Lottia gigantea]